MLKAKLEASLRLGRDALYPVSRELLGLLRALRTHGSLITREASPVSIHSAATVRSGIAKVGGYDCDATGEPVHLSDLFRR